MRERAEAAMKAAKNALDEVETCRLRSQAVLVQRELDNYYRRPSEYIAGLTLAL